VIPTPTLRGATRLETVAAAADLEGLRWGDLSDFFNPFLDHFAREALRCGGVVRVARRGAEAVGLYLYHPFEREGSVFARDRAIAEAFPPAPEEVAVYSEFALGPTSERFEVYSGELRATDAGRHFAHAVRCAEPSDGPAILALLREVHGPVDPRWLDGARSPAETCFLVDGGTELAGVGWTSLARGAGRLHSLAVRPRYRRTGVGTDLLHARKDWLRAHGASRVIAEIAERNAGSRRIADAGGLSAVGRMYRATRDGTGRD